MRNPIQFQKGLSLPEFMEMYGTEQQCVDKWVQYKKVKPLMTGLN